jgi:hypothetical protein
VHDRWVVALRGATVQPVIEVKRDSAPLVIVSLTGDISIADVGVQRELYQRVHGGAQRFALIVDVRRVHLPSKSTIRALGDLANEFGDATKRDIVCIGVILGRALAAAAQAVRFLVRPEVDIVYFPRARDAFVYARAKARREGVELPDEDLVRSLDEVRAA